MAMHFRLLAWFFALPLFACSEINSGWTVDGGGYMNLDVNGESVRMEIDPDDGDVDLRLNKHYVTFLGKNASGDALQVLVSKPVLGKNVPQTNPAYTYLVRENGLPAKILAAYSNEVRFDQKDSILWSADLHLVFNACGIDACDDSAKVVVTGRMRYWVDPDDR